MPPNPNDPEALARQHIDRQLAQCGWLVQSRPDMNISAGLGVAVREFPLKTGYADYLLYVDGKAAGVIEAKPEGHTLKGVELQASKYTLGLPDGLPAHRKPLPFAYESTGIETQFTNALEVDARSRAVFTFHRPEELLRLIGLPQQLRTALREPAPLAAEKLWRVQREAIANLDASMAQNRPRSLIQMATGSGKTFTACNFSYRLLRFAGARRILFLVDRNNLGKQALNEFQSFQSPHNSYKFHEEYPVQRLTKNTIDPAAKVVITTIQRLYSMLKGEEHFDEDAEDKSGFETANPLLKEPLPVVYNARIPIESFDIIVIDECHRSIYNVWRQALEYFDAFLIGLTATPSAQTLGFFNNNLVQDYSHEKAVVDGVNVGYDVYKIRTKITEKGATLDAEPGYFVPHRDRRTRQTRFAELDADLPYTASQLDRDVVAKDQIRLVIKTFKERINTEMFPGRSDVPKTLVFAKDDAHAEDIVAEIREQFGKGNDFCWKITSKTTGRKAEDVLAEFRNSYFPRIAVTVDMIATGTDVKAIECLLFMRNIASAAYFEQMKGRGVRVISDEALGSVTRDAVAQGGKTRFVIVDAVGVCESDKSLSKPLDRKPGVSLEKVLDMVASGMVHVDVVSALAAKLTRLAHEADYTQRMAVAKEIKDAIAPQAAPTNDFQGQGLETLAAQLFAAIDPDKTLTAAQLTSGKAEPTEAQLDAAEQTAMQAALKPFHHAPLRKIILAVREANREQVIDEVTKDNLTASEFNAAAKAKAQTVLADLRKFCADHKADIEALQLLYSKPYRAGLNYKQVRDLATRLKQFHVDPAKPASVHWLWQQAQAAEPNAVKGQPKALVDLIALVRHAIHPEAQAIPRTEEIEPAYTAWLQEKQKQGPPFTSEQRIWLDAIKNHIAASLAIERDDFEDVPFSQMGGLGKVVQLFGERLPVLLDELNERLAA